jgi:hypothetical protein
MMGWPQYVVDAWINGAIALVIVVVSVVTVLAVERVLMALVKWIKRR